MGLVRIEFSFENSFWGKIVTVGGGIKLKAVHWLLGICFFASLCLENLFTYIKIYNIYIV